MAAAMTPVPEAARPILVIGRSGQVARALAAASETAGAGCVFVGRPEVDLLQPGQISKAIGDMAPSVVINAAAYTAVDQAETDVAVAMRINRDAVREIAEAADAAGATLIHFSTDYVFDGESRRPYRPTDPVNPLNVYGASKAAGETAIREATDRHLIVRTSWVYDETGRNFLTTMLRLGAERPELRIVDDQVGSPTYAGDLGRVVLALAGRLAGGEALPSGTYHLTNRGTTSWFGFAREIFEAAGSPSPKLVPITTAEYPTPAKRPAYSVLDMSETEAKLRVEMPDWQASLALCLSRRA